MLSMQKRLESTPRRKNIGCTSLYIFAKFFAKFYAETPNGSSAPQSAKRRKKKSRSAQRANLVESAKRDFDSTKIANESGMTLESWQTIGNDESMRSASSAVSADIVFLLRYSSECVVFDKLDGNYTAKMRKHAAAYRYSCNTVSAAALRSSPHGC